jgi:hypothetical protein
LVLTLLIALGTLVQDFRYDRSLSQAHETTRAIDRQFSALDVSLAELRASEAGYVASGQSLDVWTARVGEILSGIEASIGNLSSAAVDITAKTQIEAAAAAFVEIKRIEERAREFANKDQKFLASDLIFMDGVEASRRFGQALAQARATELAAAQARESRLAWTRFGMNAVALGFAIVVMLYYARSAQPAEEPPRSLDLRSQEPPAPVVMAPPPSIASPPPPPVTTAVNLTETAELCVDLARVTDGADVPPLLERAARVLDAKGVVLWMADADGALLRPTLSYGYGDKVLNRLGTLRMDGENVTALAYRSMKPQSVSSTTAKGNGALAIPLVTASGCLGVLAAEIRQGKPSAERLAIARVIGAQFASLVAPAAEATEAAGKAAEA